MSGESCGIIGCEHGRGERECRQRLEDSVEVRS